MIDFEAALRVLTEADVQFVVVGAFAAVAHGSLQVTRDLDICYARTPENLRRLAASLAPYRPRLRGVEQSLPFSLDAQALSQGMNFTLQTDLGDIDLMGQLSGVGGYDDVIKGAHKLHLYGKEVQIASLDAVIRSKRAAGRPKDLIALPELEALKELQATDDKSKKNSESS